MCVYISMVPGDVRAKVHCVPLGGGGRETFGGLTNYSFSKVKTLYIGSIRVLDILVFSKYSDLTL